MFEKNDIDGAVPGTTNETLSLPGHEKIEAEKIYYEYSNIADITG